MSNGVTHRRRQYLSSHFLEQCLGVLSGPVEALAEPSVDVGQHGARLISARQDSCGNWQPTIRGAAYRPADAL
jgi:hypothetical protein